MRFACLSVAAPGADLQAQCAAIADAGCAGVETIVFPHTQLEQWQLEFRVATANSNLQPVAVIVGGLALFAGDQSAYVREAMQAIAEVNAAVLLTPEYQSQNPLPLFPPHPRPPVEEQAQVDRALDEISIGATQFNARVFLEPITQFESRFWREVDTVRRVCERLNNPLVQVVLDFHNMNITEADISQSIRNTGPYIGHVHLADNNRRLPGRGHIQFAEGLSALYEVGYTGWYSFECAIAHDDFPGELQRCMAWLEGLS